MTTIVHTLSSIPGLQGWSFAPKQTNDPVIARWALTLPDQELDAFAASVEDEMSKVLHSVPPHEEHPHCGCEEAHERLTMLAEKKKAVEYELYARRGMSAHQKMARMAAALTSPTPR